MGIDPKSAKGQVARALVVNAAHFALHLHPLNKTWHQALVESNNSGRSVIATVFDVLNIHPKFVGYEGKIDPTRGAVIAVNHPTGPLDAPMGIRFNEQRSDVPRDFKFFAVEYSKAFQGMENSILAVDTRNKEGAAPELRAKAVRSNFSSVRRALELLQKDKGTLIVNPAAAISKIENEELKDVPWRKHFVGMARATNSIIYPLAIDDLQNPTKFYTNKFQNKVRWDLTMLPHLNKEPTVRVIDPIDPNLEPYKSMSDQELADHIYKLVHQKEAPPSSEEAVQ